MTLDFGMASSVQSCDCLRALEFYAGVGGFHYGLLKSGVNADVVGSFDLNPTANKIYRHNFPNTAHLNRNICGLTASELDKLEPDIMHMSPPCQPFTRQGLRRDKEDRRTDSFFHLMLTISEMRSPPNYILMENVQGFESSHTRNEFTQTLERAGYSYQEFLLSPSQFGVPNSRLRYYLLAKKRPLMFALEPVKQPSNDGNALLDCVALLSCNRCLKKTGQHQCVCVCVCVCVCACVCVCMRVLEWVIALYFLIDPITLSTYCRYFIKGIFNT